MTNITNITNITTIINHPFQLALQLALLKTCLKFSITSQMPSKTWCETVSL